MELQNNYPNRPHAIPAGPSFKNDQSFIVTSDGKKAKEFTNTFDYVIVFKMEDKDGQMVQSDVAKHVMHAMLESGLEIYPYLSVQDDELLVLFRCPVRFNF